MTLVLAVLGPESIWLLTNRRLSRGRRPFRDDARKTMFVAAKDGVAMLGYAGLGETRGGTEPADWMSAVLHGRKLTVEQALGAVSAATRRQLPRHMTGLPSHHVIAPAYVGNEARLYTIDLVSAARGKRLYHRYTQHVSDWHSRVKTAPRFGLSGSGAHYLLQYKTGGRDLLLHKAWGRPLLGMVDAHDRKRVSTLAVADRFASLNNTVHRGLRDNSVGPRCIVSWRFRENGVHGSGGGQQFYTGTKRDAESPSPPLVDTRLGFDVDAFGQVLAPHLVKQMKAQMSGDLFRVDEDAINAEYERIAQRPDEYLK